METKMTDHSLVSLIRELRDETTTLVRQEIALAKAETCEKASRLGRNAAYIGAGVALGYAALILFLLGIRDVLAAAFIKGDMDPNVATWLSSFIVALLIGISSWLLIAKGKKALAKDGLIPRKTIQSLRDDQHFIKQKLART
jgi:hypothetical protein